MMATTDEKFDVETLLPFYANGTLEPEERERVEAALKDNPELQAEARALGMLRETMKELDFGTSPGQFGMARVLRDIDRSEQQKATIPVLPWGVAAAAVAALFAIGIVWVTEPSDAPFMQASGDANDALLTVSFQPDATQAEISELLLDLQLEIAGGPSAIGLYRLDPGGDRDLDRLASDLRNRRDLVESVDLP